MKRTLALASLLASGLSLNAVAQTPAAPAPAAAAAPAAVTPVPAKVAVIAFQVAVAQTNEGQRNFSDVQKKFEPKRAELKTLNDEVENLKKQLQAQGEKLSPAESAARTKIRIDEKTKSAPAPGRRTPRTDTSKTEVQDMYNSLASKVFEVVDAYAKQQGFTLVLDASNQQSNILWASEATNITQPIIAAYNAKSGVPAPPAGPPSAPAPQGTTKPAAPRKPATPPSN